jgi:hypothetical protein
LCTTAGTSAVWTCIVDSMFCKGTFMIFYLCTNITFQLLEIELFLNEFNELVAPLFFVSLKHLLHMITL